MAIGDQAAAAGYPLVPDSGEDGKVKYGAREINKTRDIAAQVQGMIPTGRAAFRAAAGITSGTDNPNPADGMDGDIYLMILS